MQAGRVSGGCLWALLLWASFRGGRERCVREERPAVTAEEAGTSAGKRIEALAEGLQRAWEGGKQRQVQRPEEVRLKTRRNDR